jgi:phage terminase large subunit
VAVDPAAEAFRIELMRAGIPGLITADNDVSYGLSLISTLLGVDQLHISDRCASLIGEFPGYSWDSTAAAKGTDKPIKAADHSLDALRYSIVTTERDWRPLLERAQ